MNVLDAFELIRARTTEHHAGGEGAGLTIVLEQLGIDPDDMEVAMPSVFYEHAVINMPVPAQLVMAFAAGAIYTRGNHSSLAESVPEEVVGRLVPIARKLWEDSQRGTTVIRDAGYMQEAAMAIEALIRFGPAAGPPTDDGAEASS